jgi:hypothetical protein
VTLCIDGFGDCDMEPATGCEADLADDVAHCGACGAACSNEHGRTRCIEGACAPTCNQGFADCDSNPDNGCETDLLSSANHCGECGMRCRADNATGVCADGVCGVECESGFADCNGDFSDGCEANLATPETCGDCTTHCSDNGGIASCNAQGECEIDCSSGRGDCINGALDGCETNTNASVRHCGECETTCPADDGTPACFEGVCGLSNCVEPSAECDGDPDTSCETNLTDDPNNCGACGTECYFANAIEACVNRACLVEECEPAWDDCDGDSSTGCETALGTIQNCAACGNACTNAHGSTACAGSPGSFACMPECSLGWFDCENPDDGCETNATMTTVRATTGNARALVSWGPVAGATGYTVRRGTTSGGPYTEVATGVTATSYLNTDLMNGTTYYYVVAAEIPCATGPNSAEVAARTDGLIVAHYLFDETSGTSAADFSGNNRTATLSGASWTAGRRGNAVRIAGGTQRVNLPSNIVQGCNDLTIAGWVRLTTKPDWARIFDFGGGTNNYMFLTARPLGDELRFVITTSGTGGEQRLQHGYTFPTATWKHVAIVLAGNTGRLYLDGVEVAQNAGLSLNPSNLGGTGNNWLGDSQFSEDPTLDGAIDDFRISCRAYSAAEITALTQ